MTPEEDNIVTVNLGLPLLVGLELLVLVSFDCSGSSAVDPVEITLMYVSV